MLWQEKLTINNYILKNRIVFPPISPNWAEEDGSISDELLDFYKNIAKGGCSMIIVCGTAISHSAKGIKYSTVLQSDHHINSFTKLSEIIKENNCLPIIQLMHVGGQGNPLFNDSTPVAPSTFFCEATNCTAKELTLNEIKKIEYDFIHSSKLAYNCGFEGVELHIAHGYLLHEFVSEHFNKRKDEYGQDLNGRLKIVTNIIQNIKKEFPNKILGIRISAEDYIDDGLNIEKNSQIIPILEKLKIDYISITAGIYKTSKEKHEALNQQKFFEYAQNIKKITNLPIISVGKVLNLENAENFLRNKSCDLIAMGRAMVADPFIINKYYTNEKVIGCIECNVCSYLRRKKTYMTCSQRKYFK